MKSRALEHVSTSTKHAKSLCVQIEAASRSVLSLMFLSLTEQSCDVEGRKGSFYSSLALAPLLNSMSKLLVVLQGFLYLRTNWDAGQSSAEEEMLFASLIMASCASLCVIDLISSVVVLPFLLWKAYHYNMISE